MKKYILSAVSLFVLLVVSCSNEDITIEAPSTITINASSVISPFTYEDYPGELEIFDNANFRIRIRALVYNEKGELVKKDSAFYTNYNVQLKVTEFLSKGTYIVLGISDVVMVSGSAVSKELWVMSGESKLSEMTIKSAGMIGNSAKVLGVAKNTLNVQESQGNNVEINLQPAGALVYCYFENMKVFSNVTHYKLMANKTAESLSFDRNGNYTVTENQDAETLFRLARVSADKSSDHTYNFILPMKNVAMIFCAELEDGSNYVFKNDLGAQVDVVAGDEYKCTLTLNSNENRVKAEYIYANKSRTRMIEWSDQWIERCGYKQLNTNCSIENE